ncbi:hypothetical protein OSB04_027856 [Centaurea solstitialis]|uniref:Uncharacterized protein n=1 Tax=Centaurea solstitialis TaxID=347529 RepID=A0AA38SEL8_9ASTR|nr:hypothetical protein OSB04_027856 [Centaurea solstitialis]
MVFSAIKNREFDYARSIWDDMVKKVRNKNRVANVAFTRFFSAVLELHMGANYPKVGNSNNYALGPRFLDQVVHHPDDVPLSDVLVVPEPAQDQDQEDAEPSTAPTAGMFSIISSKPHSSTSMHAMSVANPILTSPAATTTSALQKRPQPSSATPPPPTKRAKARAQKKKTQAAGKKYYITLPQLFNKPSPLSKRSSNADTSTSAPVTQEPEVVQLEPSANLVGNHPDTLQASGNISMQHITVPSSMKTNESSSAHLVTMSTGSLGAGSEGHLQQDDPFNDFILTDTEHQLNAAELRRQSAERTLQEAHTAFQQKEAEHSAQLQSLQQELVAAQAAAAAAEAAAASATAAAIAATPPPTAVTLSIPCLDNIHDKVSQVASFSSNLQASIDDLKATAFPALSTNIINSTNSLTTFQTTVVQRLYAQEAALRAIQEQVQGLSTAVNALSTAPAPPPSFTTADREVLQSLITSSFIQRKVLGDMASLLQRSVTTAALLQAPAEGERQPRDHSAYSPSTNWRTTEDGGNNEDDDDDDEDDDDADDDIFIEKVPTDSTPIPGQAQSQGENPDASGKSLLPSSPSTSDNQPISTLLKSKPTPETITLDSSPENSPPNNLQMVIYQPPKLPSPEPTPELTSAPEPEPFNQADPETHDVNFGSVTGDIIRLMENSPNEQTRAEVAKMTFRITPLNQETISTRPSTRFNQEASSSRTPEIRATPETICLSSDDEFISDDFSTPASSPRSPPSNSPRSEGENYPDSSFAIDRDGRLDAVIERLESTRVKIPLRTSCDSEFAYLSQEEYNEAVQAQLEHNKKQKEAFLSAQAARRLASDFVDQDAEISADPILAQKAVLKVFNKNAEIQTGEVNAELDWCRDRLHLRKHGAAISGIHLRRSRGKKNNPGKTLITVKRSGVKDVEHTLDKLDRYNLSEWNEIRSLLPKANKNYRAEVEEVIEGLIARIRRTTEIPDDLLHYSPLPTQQPVRRSAGTSTRRPTPCLPRMVVKPLDLSMLDLSFPQGITLSEGQDKKNPDNKEIIRNVRAILDHRLAFSETPVPVTYLGPTQFINSLRSEWRRYASNIQQNRNLEDIDIHELYELLNHNQDEVLETMSNMKKVEKYADPLALVADRRQFTSGRSPRYEDEYDVPSDNGAKGSDSDEEMNDMKKALALITRTLSKRNLRKPMSSNNHRYYTGKRYENKPRGEVRRYERPAEFDTRRYEEPRERRYDERRYQERHYDDQERRYDDNEKRYDEPRRFDQEPRRLEQGSRAVYHKPEEKAKTDDKGKEPKKDGSPTCFKCGKPGHFAKNCINHVSKYDYYKNKMNLAKKQDDGLALLAEDEAWLQMSSDDEERDVDEEYSEDDDRDYNDVNSDHSDSSSEIKQANKQTTIAESKLASEHALVVKFNIELAYSKDKVNMLTLANITLEDKVTSLNANITDLQKRLHEAERVSSENVKKYEFIFAQRINLFAKIKDMEDKFLKRGQTDQTIHMNQPKEFNYYNPKEGIGYKSPCYLKRAISKTPTLYDLRYMSLGYKIIFMKESDDPEQLKEIEKKEKARKNKQSFPFNYSSLNASYATREIPLSKDYTPSYTEAEMNQEVPILEKVYKDNQTFYEKRIAKLEAELEDERRMSLREKDLFLSKINELEEALKSKSTPKASQSTFGTRDNSHHHNHTWNVNALDFRPSSTSFTNSKSMVLRSPICTTISYMEDLPYMALKSTVQISEIVSDDCTNRVGENSRSSGQFKSGNKAPPKLSRKDKGKDKLVTLSLKLRVHLDGHVWYMDSGCSKHMTGRKELLANFKQKYGGNVRFGNKLSAPIMGYGDILHHKITINKVAYVEGLSHNLLSIGKFCDKKLEVNFRETRCCVRTYDGQELIEGTRRSNLYTVNFRKQRPFTEVCLLSKATFNQNVLWHWRLSHPNYATINQLAKTGLVTGLPSLKFTKEQLCSACEMGKIKKSSHKLKVEHNTSKPLQLIHMDLCGPMRVQSINGRKYVLVIVDDFSRYTWVNFLRSKDGASDIIISFIRNVQVRLQLPVQVIRTDNGTEFKNHKLDSFLDSVGITHTFSTARTPQKNGVVERKNRTLVEVARTMLAFSKLPLHFWAEAVASACFTQNRSLITKRFMKTPYELVYNLPPSIKFFRVFGCECYVKNDKDNLDKFSPKGDEGVFIGYAMDSPSYRV